jgi:predicted nucleic acid-binding protein
MVYLDTSCLLKLFLVEPESDAIAEIIGKESRVIISALTELEAEIQLKAACMGGRIRLSQWREHQQKLAGFRQFEPFEFRTLSGDVFSAGLEQNRRQLKIHCRTLDRLHLAAMAELKVTSLLTLDQGQAAAAQAMGYEIIRPGRS